MAERLMSYSQLVADGAGQYRASAVGREAADGMWEAWLEFEPLPEETEVLVSGIESRQSRREQLVYWATGLTPVYLEGALARAREAAATPAAGVLGPPPRGAPAAGATVAIRGAAAGPEPVMDPFIIGSRNLDILRQELGALNRPRLINIIEAHRLNPAAEDLTLMSDRQLAAFIVTAVETQLRLGSPRRQ